MSNRIVVFIIKLHLYVHCTRKVQFVIHMCTDLILTVMMDRLLEMIEKFSLSECVPGNLY
jgi:hypothetical protein